MSSVQHSESREAKQETKKEEEKEKGIRDLGRGKRKRNRRGATCFALLFSVNCERPPFSLVRSHSDLA
jgi:hypothetical protein